MKKTVLIIAVLGLLLSGTTVLAKSQPKGQPFDAIWKAINQLEKKVNDINDDDDDNDGNHNATTTVHILGAPNYDSGWISMTTANNTTLNHNLGGDTNKYVTDTDYRTTSGNQTDSPDARNQAWWENLTATSMMLKTATSATTTIDAVRIKIWKY